MTYVLVVVLMTFEYVSRKERINVPNNFFYDGIEVYYRKIANQLSLPCKPVES
jgi:hypothetical protein